MLFFAKRESPKLLSHVLAVCELLYSAYGSEFPELKDFLVRRIRYEIDLANASESVFEIVWCVFFSRIAGLGITDFGQLVTSPNVQQNPFYKSIVASRQLVFSDSAVDLFMKQRDCRDKTLAKHVAAFR